MHDLDRDNPINFLLYKCKNMSQNKSNLSIWWKDTGICVAGKRIKKKKNTKNALKEHLQITKSF